MTDNKLENTALPLDDDELDKVAGGIGFEFGSSDVEECSVICPICMLRVTLYLDKASLSGPFINPRETAIRRLLGEHINSEHPTRYAEWLQSNPL